MRLAIAALIAATTIISSADAQRLDTTSMSCQQAAAIVAREGAVVLGSGPLIYDRYVSSSRFCSYGERTRPAVVPTRDVSQCVIGNLCVTEDPLFRFSGR